MAGMKRVLGFLAIIGDCDLLFPLHYGSVIHKSWPGLVSDGRRWLGLSSAWI
jgi:hypothetical protein